MVKYHFPWQNWSKRLSVVTHAPWRNKVQNTNFCIPFIYLGTWYLRIRNVCVIRVSSPHQNVTRNCCMSRNWKIVKGNESKSHMKLPEHSSKAKTDFKRHAIAHGLLDIWTCCQFFLADLPTWGGNMGLKLHPGVDFLDHDFL